MEDIYSNKEIPINQNLYPDEKFGENQEIFHLIKEDGLKLKDFDYQTRDTETVVLEAVKNNGLALKYASRRIKDNKGVVLAAVKNVGDALEHASNNLKDDADVVLAAVKSGGTSLFYASDDLRKDYSIVYEAVKQNGLALKYVSNKDLCCDLELVKEALKSNSKSFKLFGDDIKENEEIVFEAVKRNVENFKFACDILRKDKEFILKVVKFDPRAYKYRYCSCSYTCKGGCYHCIDYIDVLREVYEKDYNFAKKYSTTYTWNRFTLELKKKKIQQIKEKLKSLNNFKRIRLWVIWFCRGRFFLPYKNFYEFVNQKYLK